MTRNTNKASHDIKEWYAFFKPFVFTLGILLVVVGIIFSISAYYFNKELQEYSTKGIKTTANITSKEVSRGRTPKYKIYVSYVSGGALLEGGKVQITEVEYVSGILYYKFNEGDNVEVYYLPQDTKRVLLAATMLKENQAPIERTDYALYLLAIGAILCVFGKVTTLNPKITSFDKA